VLSAFISGEILGPVSRARLEQKRWQSAAKMGYNRRMSPHDIAAQNDGKVDLLQKTVAYYRWSLEHYEEFARTERKPRSKRQLEQRLKSVLQEIADLKRHPVA
jgi:hypothetical protein